MPKNILIQSNENAGGQVMVQYYIPLNISTILYG
jgi:hypothetical protein